jgi:single-strand DNA-binding protein
VAQPRRLPAHRRNRPRLREEGLEYRTEIIVNDLVLLSGRGEGGESGGSYSKSATSYDQRPPAHADDLVQSTEITDDDIPF